MELDVPQTTFAHVNLPHGYRLSSPALSLLRLRSHFMLLRICKFPGLTAIETYANNTLRGIMLKGSDFSGIAGQLAALLTFALAKVLLSALTMADRVICRPSILRPALVEAAPGN